MSYLGISEAAWSLVLSKDPHIRPNARSAVPVDSADPTALTAGLSKAATATSTNVARACTDPKHSAQPASQRRCSSAEAVHCKAGGASLVAAGVDTVDLPSELQLGQQQRHKAPPPSSWSPCSGEPPGTWLSDAHGPTWQAESAAVAREAAVAHRQLMGQLEQRRAALLKDIGHARDLNLKLLLTLVTEYTDEVQVLLTAAQGSALKAQQDFTSKLTALASGAVGGSIEAALEAARKKHQEQLSYVTQQQAAQLESARVSAQQQLSSALQLQRQQAEQQLHEQLQEVNDKWAAKCTTAEAAAAKQQALKEHAEAECTKLRAELAAAKREAATWRSRWESECTIGSGSIAGGAGGSGGLSTAASGNLVAFEGGFAAAGRLSTPSRLSRH